MWHFKDSIREFIFLLLQPRISQHQDCTSFIWTIIRYFMFQQEMWQLQKQITSFQAFLQNLAHLSILCVSIQQHLLKLAIWWWLMRQLQEFCPAQAFITIPSQVNSVIYRCQMCKQLPLYFLNRFSRLLLHHGPLKISQSTTALWKALFLANGQNSQWTNFLWQIPRVCNVPCCFCNYLLTIYVIMYE